MDKQKLNKGDYMIKAKAVVPEQFWILRQDDQKIGNIEATADGYSVSINGKSMVVKNLNTFSQQVSIKFENYTKEQKEEAVYDVHGFPTSAPAYNAVFDVKHQLPIWTTEPRSRSWLAAGWYRVKQHRDWKVIYCPKLIFLERYTYQGPFGSLDQAKLI
jgi:hypothetical protein